MARSHCVVALCVELIHMCRRLGQRCWVPACGVVLLDVGQSGLSRWVYVRCLAGLYVNLQEFGM